MSLRRPVRPSGYRPPPAVSPRQFTLQTPQVTTRWTGRHIAPPQRKSSFSRQHQLLKDRFLSLSLDHVFVCRPTTCLNPHIDYSRLSIYISRNYCCILVYICSCINYVVNRKECRVETSLWSLPDKEDFVCCVKSELRPYFHYLTRWIPIEPSRPTIEPVLGMLAPSEVRERQLSRRQQQ